ncbi:MULTISPECIES: oleate hydratase [Bradyrhizobium]|uniref:oleate hydratase n=1 Tax=Bradyrhizobium TaxID=374 RepID=UPI001FDA7E67|nr:MULTISPECIES: oleate hydratase [Bradyrhizobium]UWU93638.1 oleate hydratase [Bradyrhizobium sp. CB1015]
MVRWFELGGTLRRGVHDPRRAYAWPIALPSRALNLPGGALDGSWDPERGVVIRGDPEMEEHFECLWDLFRSVLLAEILGQTAMEAVYILLRLNAACPRYSIDL